MQVLGSISGSGKITLIDRNAPADTPPAVDLDLEKVLGKMPRKTLNLCGGLSTSSLSTFPRSQALWKPWTGS